MPRSRWFCPRTTSTPVICTTASEAAPLDTTPIQPTSPPARRATFPPPWGRRAVTLGRSVRDPTSWTCRRRRPARHSRAPRRPLGRHGYQLRAVVGGGAGGRPLPVRRRRHRAAAPARGDDPPGLARPVDRRRTGPALRLPRPRPVRPGVGSPLQPRQAAARPLRAGGG